MEVPNPTAAAEEDIKEIPSKSNSQKESGSEFSQRRDVVNKTILRNMRRFFLKQFNDMFEYTTKKRNKGTGYYLACVDQLLETLFPAMQDPTERDEVAFYLGALLYPKDMKRSKGTSRLKREVDKVYASLYSYSHAKLNKLIRVRTFGRLFGLFCTNTDEAEFEQGPTVLKNKEVYVEALQSLRARFEAST